MATPLPPLHQQNADAAGGSPSLLDLFLDAASAGPVMRIAANGDKSVLVTGAAEAHAVLADRQDIYLKTSPAIDRIRDVFGDGLLTSSGERWRERRRQVQPAFNKDGLNSFATAANQAAEELCERLRHPGATSGVDARPALERTVLSMLSRALLTELEPSQWPAVESMAAVLSGTLAPYRIPRALAALDAVIRDHAAARRAGVRRDDLLDFLMQLRDPTSGELLSDDELCIEVRTLFLGGFETTVQAASWTAVLLAQYPDEARIWREELAAAGLVSGAIDLRDLRLLRRGRWVVSEALRLFPPVWNITRTAVRDDVLGGYAIPAGTTMMVLPYAVHRNRAVWGEDADAFRPERFREVEASAIMRLSFMPFGKGPRTCIAAGMATTALQIIMGRIVQGLALSRVDDRPVVPVVGMSLNVPDGVRLIACPHGAGAGS